MNQELRDLEARLRQLHPRAPAEALTERIERALEEARSAPREQAGDSPGGGPVVQRPFLVSLRRMLPVAAALMLGLGIATIAHFAIREPAEEPWTDEDPVADAVPAVPESKPESGPVDAAVAASRLRPVRADNIYKNRLDEGLVISGDGMAARQYRYQFIDTVTWKDPSDGSEVTVSVPREEVVLVPVHTF